jgi:hypothetical protein
VVCPCKLADGAGWEWDEWNVVEKFRANIVYLVDIVDGISNFSGGIKRET